MYTQYTRFILFSTVQSMHTQYTLLNVQFMYTQITVQTLHNNLITNINKKCTPKISKTPDEVFVSVSTYVAHSQYPHFSYC